MGNRLSKIVTRTGDSGTTGLGDGSRVGKDSPRIDTLGELDELNSSIGVLLAEELPEPVGAKIRECLLTVQNHLFDLGGEICIPGHKSIGEAAITQRVHPPRRYSACSVGASVSYHLPTRRAFYRSPGPQRSGFGTCAPIS